LGRIGTPLGTPLSLLCRCWFLNKQLEHLKKITTLKNHIQIRNLAILFLLLTSFTFPKKTETTSFFVNADCPMCEERIEAACDIKGVVNADYNLDSYTLTVSYKPAKISIEQIHAAIAGAGYDTSMAKATEDNYNQLPGCCQYDRSRTSKQ